MSEPIVLAVEIETLERKLKDCKTIQTINDDMVSILIKHFIKNKEVTINHKNNIKIVY